MVLGRENSTIALSRYIGGLIPMSYPTPAARRSVVTTRARRSHFLACPRGFIAPPPSHPPCFPPPAPRPRTPANDTSPARDNDSEPRRGDGQFIIRKLRTAECGTPHP